MIDKGDKVTWKAGPDGPETVTVIGGERPDAVDFEGLDDVSGGRPMCWIQRESGEKERIAADELEPLGGDA